MAAATTSTFSNALSTSPIKTFSTIDVNIAQIILEIVIIITITLEKVQNTYMRRFISVFLAALWLETFLIGSYAFVLHSMVNIRLAIFIWNLYELVRHFVSLSLCYAIIVFTNKSIKLRLVFLVISSFIIIGSIINCTKSNPETSSGHNNIAFMFIFLFTLYQYYQLKSNIHHDNDDKNVIKGLKRLIAIEIILIFLNGLLLILFFSKTDYLLESLRLSIILIQYLKIYIIMSLFATFNITVEKSHRI